VTGTYIQITHYLHDNPTTIELVVFQNADRKLEQIYLDLMVI
jgi:hypothetical protein